MFYLWHCICSWLGMLLSKRDSVWPSPQIQAAIAQLGERQTEDLKVPGSIPGLGMVFFIKERNRSMAAAGRTYLWKHHAPKTIRKYEQENPSRPCSSFSKAFFCCFFMFFVLVCLFCFCVFLFFFLFFVLPTILFLGFGCLRNQFFAIFIDGRDTIRLHDRLGRRHAIHTWPG